MSPRTTFKMDRRRFLASTAATTAVLASPALAQNTGSVEIESDISSVVRRNISSFRSLDWRPYFANLKKGAILVGADADIVVWDPEKEKTITAASQQSAIDYNVFEGKHVKGLPRFTLTRGHIAVHDGEIRTEEGHGKFVRREANNPVNKALSNWKELTAPRPVERTGIPATGV